MIPWNQWLSLAFLLAKAGWISINWAFEDITMGNPINQNGSGRIFYSVSEVADLFGISRKSVYRLLSRGILKSSTALRHKMISRRSVEGFLSTTDNGGVK